MNPTYYKIHPAIGIARLGNSPTDFYLAPESCGALPIEVDPTGHIPLVNGQEQVITTFRDANNLVKRQAARFRVYIYDDQSPQGRPITVGTQPNGAGGDQITGVGTRGQLVDIQWSVYLANKKSSWYEWHELQGEYGYKKKAKLRNAAVKSTKNKTDRLKLIIDPGPQTVSGIGARAEFAKGKNPFAAQNFPPPLIPNSIDSLGEIRTYDDHSLFVLGGFGNSGTSNTGPGEPQTHSYANNDGWYDDISDGPVVATLVYWNEQDQMLSYVQATGAWVMVGYPRFVPQIPDIVTMDDLLYDMYVRKFNYAPYLYREAAAAAEIPPAGHGTRIQRKQAAPDDQQKACDDPIAPAKMFNPDYYPYWDTEIYPILSRPYLYGSTVAILNTSDPHEVNPGGYFDMTKISVPPSGDNDPYLAQRQFIHSMLRQPGEENELTTEIPMHQPGMLPLQLPKMPLLNGDNPLTNKVVSKFFRLTKTQLFLLKQWADGKFIGGNLPAGTTPIGPPPDGPGTALDRGVLSNCLGGAFCPGAELTWFIRNCRLFEVTMTNGVISNGIYRIRHKLSIGPNSTAESVGDALGINYFTVNGLTLGEHLSKGLEPGDLTKRNAVPWQCDFNECTTNPTDVTHDNWNVIDLPKSQRLSYGVVWWPAHRPLQVNIPADPANPGGLLPPIQGRDWAEPIPETDQGDTMMVTLWSQLGFLMNFGTYANPNIVEVERLLPRQN
jgi:L-Lysine epsilon oxidase N-terminal/L-lysine epsilon oxidase C-terminal domain